MHDPSVCVGYHTVIRVINLPERAKRAQLPNRTRLCRPYIAAIAVLVTLFFHDWQHISNETAGCMYKPSQIAAIHGVGEGGGQ